MPALNLIGVISDTHGLIRPEALAALQGSDLILHGGDIGKPEVLDALAEIAPTVAIRGNVDKGAWAEPIPWTRTLDLNGKQVHLLHNISDLQKSAESGSDFDAVIFGHSHKARNEEHNGMLYFNPGSAGPRRFKLPVTVGRLHLINGTLKGEILELAI